MEIERRTLSTLLCVPNAFSMSQFQSHPYLVSYQGKVDWHKKPRRDWIAPERTLDSYPLRMQ